LDFSIKEGNAVEQIIGICQKTREIVRVHNISILYFSFWHILYEIHGVISFSFCSETDIEILKR